MNTLNQANISKGTRVLVRVDMDVPIENGQIQEEYRLEQAIPTLNYIKEKGGLPVLMGHIGRPDGKPDPKLSTSLLKPYFDKALGEGTYELLENLRFDSREETNDEGFAKELAAKGELYVNESFATSHRAHASVVGIAKLLPSYAGLHLQKEAEILSSVLKSPEKPLVAVIGGIKVESKKPMITRFLGIADSVLVGGKLGTNWNAAIPANMQIPKDYADMGKDIGPRTIGVYTVLLSKAKTVVWSGPMGNYEDEKFMHGTKEVAKAIIASRCFSVVGGGDTVAALNKLGYLDKFSFVSTGGGAMLDFLANGNVPGLEVLGFTPAV